MLGEGLLRLEPVQSLLPAPSLGTGHQNFDCKLAGLDAFVRREGGVDCIFLGPSTVNYGINPAVVRASYRRFTGNDLRCYNFGLGSLSNPAARIVMQVLIRRYHPANIVLGTFAGQDRFGEETEDRLTTNAWVEYQLGHRTFRGWLLEHSVALRYFLRLLVWVEHPRFSISISRLEAQTEPNGFTRTLETMPNIEQPPNPVRERQFFVRFEHFSVSPEHLQALEDMLRLKSQVGLAVVEMPIHPTYMAFFGRGKADFDEAISQTRLRAENQGLLYWAPEDLHFAPDQWWNRYHLNAAGAKIFSAWLGEKIARASRHGRIESQERTHEPGG